MTEDKGKEEEKFDLSPELEGYISLDEARVLALQHARDNFEVYGRYAKVELVVEVIGAVQTKTSTRSHSLSYHPVTSRPWPGAKPWPAFIASCFYCPISTHFPLRQ